jgi:hypothetical protein
MRCHHLNNPPWAYFGTNSIPYAASPYSPSPNCMAEAISNNCCGDKYSDGLDDGPNLGEDLSSGVSFITSVLLRSEPTPTFSHTAPSIYTPSYETPDTWDCITIVSDFPDTIPAHPLDILPRVAPEPPTLRSLMCSWPYTTHCFTEFRPRHTDGDPTKLWIAP